MNPRFALLIYLILYVIGAYIASKVYIKITGESHRKIIGNNVTVFFIITTAYWLFTYLTLNLRGDISPFFNFSYNTQYILLFTFTLPTIILVALYNLKSLSSRPWYKIVTILLLLIYLETVVRAFIIVPV